MTPPILTTSLHAGQAPRRHGNVDMSNSGNEIRIRIIDSDRTTVAIRLPRTALIHVVVVVVTSILLLALLEGCGARAGGAQVMKARRPGHLLVSAGDGTDSRS